MGDYSAMKLYTTQGAPNPRLVNIYLAEKGISVPKEEVSIMKGEHKTSEYRKKSPLAQVPVLEMEDGTCMTESVAICRYFETLQPDPPLFGTDAKSIAEIEMWRRRLELLLFMPAAFSFRHMHPAMAGLESQIKEWGELSKDRTGKMIGWLNQQMEGRDFIASSGFSIADITGLVAMDFAIHAARVPLPENPPHLKRWHERLSARPSAKA